jgi:hypothetical protein
VKILKGWWDIKHENTEHMKLKNSQGGKEYLNVLDRLIKIK